MSGKAGRSGRRKKFSTEIHDYLNQHKRDIPQYLDELHSQAVAANIKSVICPQCSHKFNIEVRGGGNLIALQWFLDRYYGKAAQSLDIRSKSVVITGEQLSELLPLLLQADNKLLLTEDTTTESSDDTCQAQTVPDIPES